jgi:competence protein ComEC
MAAAFCLAVLLGRPANAANLLAAAAVILLAADPMELFRPGFQLSFGTVAGILVLYRPVHGLVFGRWLRRRGLTVFRDRQRLRRWWRLAAAQWLMQSISISVAACLAAMPLVAYHFGLVTPLAPFTTLAMLPVVAGMLWVGYLQVVLAPLAPNLAGGLAPVLAFLTDAMSWLAEALAKVPLMTFELLPVPVWAAVLATAVILAAAYRQRLGLTRAWACVVLLATAVLVVGATQMPARAGDTQLAVLDVRNGSCAVLRCPSGRTVIFDAGSRSVSDIYGRSLAPFLRQRRWPAPAAAFLSHPDIDHYSAVPALLAKTGLPRAFMHEAFGDAADARQPVTMLMEMLAEAGTSVHRLRRGQEVPLDRDVLATVLWPPPRGTGYDSLAANDASLVLRLDCGRMRVLLPGDIQEMGQRLLLELNRGDLRADVLVLPHHGSYSPAEEDFIAAVDPKIIIRSSAYRHSGVIQQVRGLSVNRRLFTTTHDGCVTVAFPKAGPTATGFADLEN